MSRKLTCVRTRTQNCLGTRIRRPLLRRSGDGAPGGTLLALDSILCRGTLPCGEREAKNCESMDALAVHV